MLASIEVRWFFDRDALSTPIVEGWIENESPYGDAGPIPKDVLWRERLEKKPDVYALVPGAADMGIKWREGELQVKARREDCGLSAFEGGLQGRVERWLKWSYKGQSIEAAFRPWFEKSARGPRIVEVAKYRALRKIQIDARGKATEVRPDTFPGRAVAVEVTALEVLGARYWSIGLEAFPDDSGMSPALAEVANKFLSRLRGVPLTAANTDSYPSWLAKLTSR